MNTISIILTTVIIICAVLAVVSIIKTRKKGTCTGNCSNCQGCRK